MTDCWHGCYREGWGRNRLRPESFAHPAKNSYGLSVRIYEHALKQGWIEPGQTVLDPFAGIGGFALEALRHGLNFVGVELEQRFVDMGQGCDCTGIGKEDWIRFQGRWDKMRYEGGRHWCPECLARAGMIANDQRVFVRKFKHPFSPLPLPGTERAVPAKMRQAMLSDAAPSTSYARNSGKIPCTGPHHYRGNIETWERQGMEGSAVIMQGDSRRLGEVLERAQLCLSSPPYSTGGLGTRSKAWFEREASGDYPKIGVSNFHQGGYGDNTDGQLAAMPDTGFEAALEEPGHTVAPKEPQSAGETPQATQRASRSVPSEAQDGAEQPVLALSSPVYIGNTASDDPDKRGGLYRDPKRRDDKTLTATYSKDEAQLAQMPEGNLALALGSPPYIGTAIEKSSAGVDLQKQYDTYRAQGGGASFQAFCETQRKHSQGYGTADGQLAALPEGDHAEACERPVIAISSPPFLAQSGGINVTAKGGPLADASLLKRHSAGNQAAAGYGSEDGQLAQMPPGDHAAAAARGRSQQALEAGAETGRAQCAISSPPHMDSMNSGNENAEARAARTGGFVQGMKTFQYGQNPNTFLSKDPSGLSNEQRRELAAQNPQIGVLHQDTFWAASRQILEQVYQVLAPNAHAIFVCKRFVRAKKIVEFPLQWARLCEAVGFKWIHHHKAWLVEDRGAQYTIDGDLEKRTVKHCGFFRRLAESKGSPPIDWEDVLCFVKEAK